MRRDRRIVRGLLRCTAESRRACRAARQSGEQPIMPARDWICHERRERMSARIGSSRLGNHVASMCPSRAKSPRHRGLTYLLSRRATVRRSIAWPSRSFVPQTSPVQSAAGFIATSLPRIRQRIVELDIVHHCREVRIVGRQIPCERHRLMDAGLPRNEREFELKPGLARLIEAQPVVAPVRPLPIVRGTRPSWLASSARERARSSAMRRRNCTSVS